MRTPFQIVSIIGNVRYLVGHSFSIEEAENKIKELKKSNPDGKYDFGWGIADVK